MHAEGKISLRHEVDAVDAATKKGIAIALEYHGATLTDTEASGRCVLFKFVKNDAPEQLIEDAQLLHDLPRKCPAE